MKVKILYAEEPAWSVDYIGQTFEVLDKPAHPEFDYTVHCEEYGDAACWLKAENCQIVEEDFQGLETAYDLPMNPTIAAFKYPTTKGITMPKKSVQELASEVFNNLSSKNITAREIEQIVELVNSMKSIQEN